MTHARDLIYVRVNKLGEDMARYGPPAPYGKMIEAGSEEDDYLHGLLNRVEDDRAHREAEKLRKRGEELKNKALCSEGGERSLGMAMGATLIVEALAMDPYEERDGQLVRKSDGEIILL